MKKKLKTKYKISNSKLFVYLTFLFVFCIIPYENNPYIIITRFTMFQFEFDLLFLYNSNILLKQFETKQNGFSRNCQFCNFTAHNHGSDSTPRDVIIGFVSQTQYNIILFLRTLRTTLSNCSIVFFFDDESLKTIDKYTLEHLTMCNCQIINFHKKNIDVYIKNYLLELTYTFIRINQQNIDRIIVADVYDTIFQSDPFNRRIPKYMIHLVNEKFNYSSTPLNMKFINDVDNNFKFSDQDKNILYFCAGYMEGETDVFLDFLDVFLKYMKEKTTDQGIINYCYLSHQFERNAVPINPVLDLNTVIRHSVGEGINTTFPFVPALYNSSLYASVIHHYYKGNFQFFMSLLKACPRPNNKYTNYSNYLFMPYVEMAEYFINEQNKS